MTDRIGKALTVTLETAVFELTHPKALVPVTLYEILIVGVTIDEPPEKV